MIKFTQDKVLLLQKLIIDSTGGAYGVRDFALLDSALENAFQTFDGKELYPTKEEKGAILGFGLVSNHAFVDGNKRIGILVMLSFLEINGVHIQAQDDDMIQLGLGIAEGKYKYPDVLKWIKNHKFD